MSDFLGHLAARAIAQPSLRPRTRSRFEPAAIEEPPLVWPATTSEEPHPQERTPEVVQVRNGDAPPAPPSFPAPTRSAEMEAGRVTRENEPAGPPSQVDSRRDSAAPPLAADDERDHDESRPSPTTPIGRNTTRRDAPMGREIEQRVEKILAPIVETVEREVRVPLPSPASATPQTPHRHDRQPPRIIEAAPALPPSGAGPHDERETRTAIGPQRATRGEARAVAAQAPAGE